MTTGIDDLISRARIVSGYSNDGVTTNYYVDAVNGSDLNDGLSPATALATIGAVYTRVPLVTFANSVTVVNLASNGALQQNYEVGGLVLYGGYAFVNSYQFRGTMVPFVPAAGPTTAALDVVPAAIVQATNASGALFNARTRLDFTTANPGWTVNDFAGRAFLQVKRAGVLRYFELPISANTANTITVDALNIVGDLLATDVVEIVQPGALITGTLFDTGFTTRVVYIRGDASFDGLFLTGAGNQAYLRGANFERIAFGGGLVVATGAVSFDRCFFGQTSALEVAGKLQVVNCCSRSTMAVGVHWSSSSTYPSRRDSQGPNVPSVVTPSVAWTAFGANALILIGGPPPGGAVVGPAYVAFSKTVGLWAATPTATFAALYVDGPGSQLYMGTGTILLGNTTAQVGIRARRGAHIRIDSATTALTGAAGADLQVETGAAVAYGTGVGQFMEALGWNGKFTRMLEGTATAPTGDASRIYT